MDLNRGLQSSKAVVLTPTQTRNRCFYSIWGRYIEKLTPASWRLLVQQSLDMCCGRPPVLLAEIVISLALSGLPHKSFPMRLSGQYQCLVTTFKHFKWDWNCWKPKPAVCMFNHWWVQHSTGWQLVYLKDLNSGRSKHCSSLTLYESSWGFTQGLIYSPAY